MFHEQLFFPCRFDSVWHNPQSGVEVSDTNPGEAYSELKKTFGVLGDYSHNNFINKTTFERGVGIHKPGTPYSFFTACYGFEGFAKTAAESGINVSDRALPVTCEVKRGTYDDAIGSVGGFAAPEYRAILISSELVITQRVRASQTVAI